MSTIPNTGTVTFTLKSVPLTDGGFRTVERLMRLERGAQRILKKLQHKRKVELNEWRPRAGREWLVRARCTRLVRVAAGQSFTLDTATSGQVNLVVIPEPGSVALAGIGLAAAAWATRRKWLRTAN